MLLVLRTKRKAGFGAFKAIDFTLAGNAAACEKFVKVFGLKTLVSCPRTYIHAPFLPLQVVAWSGSSEDQRCSQHAGGGTQGPEGDSFASRLSRSQFGAFMGKPKVLKEKGAEGAQQGKELEERSISILGHLFGMLGDGPEKERLW